MPNSHHLTPEIESALTHHYLFSHLEDDLLQRVMKSSQVLALKGDEHLFYQADTASHFFYVVSGEIKLYRLSAEGEEKVIEVIHPGQSFAEALAFMEGHPTYPVNAQAINDSVIVQFATDAFLEVLRSSVDTCLRIMAGMAKRLHQQLTDIDNLTLHNATYRLIAYLLEHAQNSTTQEVCLSIPKQVIASRISVKPETFSRILARLKQADLIRVEKNEIQLLDVEGLKQRLQEE